MAKPKTPPAKAPTKQASAESAQAAPKMKMTSYVPQGVIHNNLADPNRQEQILTDAIKNQTMDPSNFSPQEVQNTIASFSKGVEIAQRLHPTATQVPELPSQTAGLGSAPRKVQQSTSSKTPTPGGRGSTQTPEEKAPEE